MTQTENTTATEPAWLRQATGIAGLCCIALLGWWALNPPPGAAGGIAARAVDPCVMDRDGYLRGQLFGQLQAELAWDGSNMRCDGMLRPDGEGIRFVFDEHLDEDLPGLLIVIGVASATPGEELRDAPANITIIDQTRGLFFSTQEDPRCWTTFTEQLQLTGTTEETWRINGELYCASPLPALQGNGAVTLGDIEYSGVFKPAVD